MSEAPRHSKEGTVAWLADNLFRGGREAALASLGKFNRINEAHHIIKSGKGVPVLRRDAPPEEADKPENASIKYWDYSPPSLWQPAYSVLRVKFSPAEVVDYMHHAGEELTVPISGGVVYSRLMPDSDGSLKRETLKKAPLKPGEVFRCQSSLPHHTWGAEPDTEAWMIFRDHSATPAAIRSKSDSGTGLDPRRVEGDFYTKNPELYAMAAFGLSESIRLVRTAADIQIHELADRCGMDRAQLSRIESGAANVSIEKLVRLGEELGFDVMEPMTWPLWGWERSSLFSGKVGDTTCTEKSPAIDRPDGPGHYLRCKAVSVPAGQTWTVPVSGNETGLMRTWLVLSGGVFFHLESEGGEQLEPESVFEGGVLHLRSNELKSVEALKTSRLLEIKCSAVRFRPGVV